MASKYLKLFPVPEGFNEILHDFAGSVLKNKPEDIIEFGMIYFESILQGKELNLKKNSIVESQYIDSKEENFEKKTNEANSVVSYQIHEGEENLDSIKKSSFSHFHNEDLNKITKSQHDIKLPNSTERKIVSQKEIKDHPTIDSYLITKPKMEKQLSSHRNNKREDSENNPSFSTNFQSMENNVVNSSLNNEIKGLILGKLFINVINLKGRNMPNCLFVKAELINNEMNQILFKTRVINDESGIEWNHKEILDLKIEEERINNYSIRLTVNERRKDNIYIVSKRIINLAGVFENEKKWSVNEYFDFENEDINNKETKTSLYLQLKWIKNDLNSNEIIQNDEPKNLNDEDSTIDNSSFLHTSEGFLHLNIQKIKGINVNENKNIYVEYWTSNKKNEHFFTKENNEMTILNEKRIFKNRFDVFNTNLCINIWNKNDNGDILLGYLSIKMENIINKKEEWINEWFNLKIDDEITKDLQIKLQMCWSCQQNDFPNID